MLRSVHWGSGGSSELAACMRTFLELGGHLRDRSNHVPSTACGATPETLDGIKVWRLGWHILQFDPACFDGFT